MAVAVTKVTYPAIKRGVLGRSRSVVTFDGSAGAGAVGTITVFTITGRVWIVRLIAFCSTLLAEAGATATLAMGVASDVDAFAGATNAVEIDADEWWVGTVPVLGAANLATTAGNGAGATIAINKALSENVILTVGAQAVNSGVLTMDAWYEPITDNGRLG